MTTAVTGSNSADISYGMRQLGQRPVQCEPAGESGPVDLIEVMERTDTFDLVHIGADDPKAMLSYAEQCRSLGIEFVADLYGRLADLGGQQLAHFISGAKFLLCTEDERALLEASTGLSDDEVLDLVRVRVTILGRGGVEIVGHDIERVRVSDARDIGFYDDHAGAAGGFRAGFLTTLAWGMSLRRAAEIGNLMATLALEAPGTDKYTVDPEIFVRRLEESFGPASAAEASAYLLPELRPFALVVGLVRVSCECTVEAEDAITP